MKSPNVNIYKVQMAYFFREKSEFRAFGLISSLYNQLNDFFKTEPQSIPIPDDAHEDVPRCVWNDVNTSLTFSKIRLDFTFNIPSKSNWQDKFAAFNEKIMSVIDECDIMIDRVGLVAEIMPSDNLQDLLKKYIQIEKFNNAKAANISWVENIESYNVWTYFLINESKDENKIVFDINSLPECKLSELGVSGRESMNECAEKLKGKMLNVL